MKNRAFLGAGAIAMLLVAGACGEDDTGPAVEQYTATLSGAAERPNAVTTNATGTATFTVGSGTVDFTITTQNIAGATAAHIHGPADASQAVGVLVTLFSAAAPGINVSNGTLSTGTFPSAQFTIKTGVTVDSVLSLLRSGNAYVNVHTVANPAGEIRGQLQAK
jgi:CHRD domain